MAVTVNIDSQIVVKTAAQWAADNTVYSAQRILITSDETYTGTDQRKFKIANGTDTWSNLDYFPVGGTVPDASETVKGIIEIATQAETDAESDDTRAVTPSKISTWLYNVYLNAAVTISGVWSFVSKLRITSANQLFYTEVASAPTSSQVWTIPDEGTQTFASKSYAVAKSGDTMTGDLTISVTGGSRLTLDAANATDPKILSWRTGLLRRWAIRVDGSGDDMAIRRYDNSGVFVDAPIQINRTSGDVSVNQLVLLNVTTAQRNALTPSAGMKVWDTDLGCECVYTGTFWKYQITKYFSGDVTNSTNVQASITGLSFSLEANAVYRVSGVYQIGCNNTGGVTFFGTFPTSTTSYFIHVAGRTNATTAVNFTGFNSTTGTASGALNTLNSAFGQAYVEGLITNGANAGTFQPQFASAVNTQTSTVYARGTYLLIERIG